MSRGPIEKEIDGHAFKLVLLGTTDAIDFLSRAGKLIEPALAGDPGDGVAKERALAAVGRLVKTLDSKELLALLRKLFTGCVMDDQPLFDTNGKSVGWEDAFAGRMGLLSSAVVWAVNENLGDFTGPLAKLTQRAAVAMGVSEEPTVITPSVAGATSKANTQSSAS